MAQYNAIINSTETFPLFSWDAVSFRSNPQLHIATDNLAQVRDILQDLQSVKIVDDQNNEMAYFTEYDGFSSILYLGRNYSGMLNGFANELVVTLTKVDLVEQVQRLDEQVNPIIDIESMTLGEYKDYKIKQFSKMGESLIFHGTDVELINGVVKNFTYNLEDQSNLLNAIFTIQALDDLTITIPYHGHAEPCELYGALDILTIYMTLQVFSTTVQTLVNMRNNWVRSCETKEEAEAIAFDTPLPEEWQDRAEAILGPALQLVEELKKKYFPIPTDTIDEVESNDGAGANEVSENGSENENESEDSE